MFGISEHGAASKIVSDTIQFPGISLARERLSKTHISHN